MESGISSYFKKTPLVDSQFIKIAYLNIAASHIFIQKVIKPHEIFSNHHSVGAFGETEKFIQYHMAVDAPMIFPYVLQLGFSHDETPVEIH